MDKINKNYKMRKKMNKMFPINQEPMEKRKEYDIDDYYKSFMKLKEISKYLSSDIQNSLDIQEDLIKKNIVDKIEKLMVGLSVKIFSIVDDGGERRKIDIYNLRLINLFSIELVYYVYQQFCNQFIPINEA